MRFGQFHLYVAYSILSKTFTGVFQHMRHSTMMSSRAFTQSACICTLSLQIVLLSCLDVKCLMHSSYWSSGYSFDLIHTCPNRSQLVSTMLFTLFAHRPADSFVTKPCRHSSSCCQGQHSWSNIEFDCWWTYMSKIAHLNHSNVRGQIQKR